MAHSVLEVAAHARPIGWTPALWRGAVIAACVIAIGAAAWFGDPRDYVQADPALARLLRGMALIKALIALAAIAAVLWRFRFPVLPPVAIGYVLGSAVLAGSTMCIWQLSFIPQAAVLFHMAGVGMLVVGWRER
jgi:hypothetical protein